jgi:hypothetical protein
LFIVRSLASSSSSSWNKKPRQLLSICTLCRSGWLG